MASEGFPAVLAVEIVEGWPTTTAGRTATVARGHGRGESHLGRRTDCFGAPVEARDWGFAAHGAAIYVLRSRLQERVRLAGLEFIRTQSCAGGARLRF